MKQFITDQDALNYTLSHIHTTRFLLIYSPDFFQYKKQIYRFLQEVSISILYQRKIEIYKNGYFNFLREIYLNQVNIRPTLLSQACFKPGHNFMMLLLLDVQSPLDLKKISGCQVEYKEKLREIFPSYNTLHITEDEDDTRMLAFSLLHKKSRQFLNESCCYFDSKVDILIDRCFEEKQTKGILSKELSKGLFGFEVSLKPLYCQSQDFFYFRGLKWECVEDL